MLIRFCLVVILLCSLQSCFTGIESTPKITLDKSVDEKNIILSDEQKYLSDIKNEPFRQWEEGKIFIVSSNKISLIFNANNFADSLSGKTISYQKFDTITSVAGNIATNLYFTHNSDTLVYHVNATPHDISSRKSFIIPFTIQQSIINEVKNRMINKEYYIITSSVYDCNGNSLSHKKFIPVKITQIEPGNHLYPLKVFFTPNSTDIFWVYMTIGDEIQSTRNFDTLFSLSNPRNKYPLISDKSWNAITNNIVFAGMPKEECRLALGAPNNIDRLPSTAGVIEYWQYDNGYQLIFEDGSLKEFRH